MGSVSASFRIVRSALGPSTFSASRGPAAGPWIGSAVPWGAGQGQAWWQERQINPQILFWPPSMNVKISLPFPAAAVQLPSKFPRYGFKVHEVAEASSGTLPAGNPAQEGLKLTPLVFNGAGPWRKSLLHNLSSMRAHQRNIWSLSPPPNTLSCYRWRSKQPSIQWKNTDS